MPKSQQMTNFLNAYTSSAFGRIPTDGECVVCGKAVDYEKDFTDVLSRREYVISHMCQECQDSAFGVQPPMMDEEIENDMQ
jgi:hypothetical protein